MALEAIKAGMTLTEYWDGDPSWIIDYVEAKKQEREAQHIWEDTHNWQLGQYVKIAVVSAFNEKSRYPEYPMFYQPTEQEEIERLKRKHGSIFGKAFSAGQGEKTD